MKTSTLRSLCLAVLLAGHGTTYAAVGTADDATCAGENDCRLKWQRAEQWLRSNSVWPIDRVTDSVIETKRRRFRDYLGLHYRITKEDSAGDRALIRFDASCLPAVHCGGDPEAARAAFVEFVMTGRQDGQ